MQHIYLFFVFWWLWVFIAACRLSLVAVSRSYSSLQCTSLLWRLILWWSKGSRCTALVVAARRFTPENVQVSGVVTHWLSYPRHVQSSWTRDWTQVPCTGRKILITLYHQGSPRCNIFHKSIIKSIFFEYGRGKVQGRETTKY